MLYTFFRYSDVIPVIPVIPVFPDIPQNDTILEGLVLR